MAAGVPAAAAVTKPAKLLRSVLFELCRGKLRSPAHHTRSGPWQRTAQRYRASFTDTEGWVGLRPYFPGAGVLGCASGIS